MRRIQHIATQTLLSRVPQHAFGPLLICFMILLFPSCDRQPRKIILEGFAQGSYYAVTYYDEQGRNFQHEIDSLFHAVDLSVNLWVDSSVICKVNRNEAVALDQIFIDNFNIAQQAAALSDGYFDPTISPLVEAWGFSAREGMEVTPEMVDSLRRLVDYRNIRIEDGKVVKANSAMRLDFNAIAQGYTSDMIGAFLESQGVSNYLVDVGGEIMARGTKPDGEAWVIGIEKPAETWDAEQVVQQRVALCDRGIVTSGSYRKYIERDGKRYSHCIDPKTGYPVEHQLLSATVLAKNSVWADALASICMVMGMERSLELIDRMEDVDAYYIFVNDQGELEYFATGGFQLLD